MVQTEAESCADYIQWLCEHINQKEAAVKLIERIGLNQKGGQRTLMNCHSSVKCFEGC